MQQKDMARMKEYFLLLSNMYAAKKASRVVAKD